MSISLDGKLTDTSFSPPTLRWKEFNVKEDAGCINEKTCLLLLCPEGYCKSCTKNINNSDNNSSNGNIEEKERDEKRDSGEGAIDDGADGDDEAEERDFCVRTFQQLIQDGVNLFCSNAYHLPLRSPTPLLRTSHSTGATPTIPTSSIGSFSNISPPPSPSAAARSDSLGRKRNRTEKDNKDRSRGKSKPEESLVPLQCRRAFFSSPPNASCSDTPWCPIPCFTFSVPDQVKLAETALAIPDRSPCLVFREMGRNHVLMTSSSTATAAAQARANDSNFHRKMKREESEEKEGEEEEEEEEDNDHKDDDDDGEKVFTLDFVKPHSFPLCHACIGIRLSNTNSFTTPCGNNSSSTCTMTASPSCASSDDNNAGNHDTILNNNNPLPSLASRSRRPPPHVAYPHHPRQYPHLPSRGRGSPSGEEEVNSYCSCRCFSHPINRNPSSIAHFFHRILSRRAQTAFQSKEHSPCFLHFSPCHGVVLLEGKCAVTSTLPSLLPPSVLHLSCCSPMGSSSPETTASFSAPASPFSLLPLSAAATPSSSSPSSMALSSTSTSTIGRPSSCREEDILQYGSLGVFWSMSCRCCPMVLMVMDHIVALLRGVTEGLIQRRRRERRHHTDASGHCGATTEEAYASSCFAGSTVSHGYPSREWGLLMDDRLAAATAELFHFFVLNIFDNDIPEQPPLWPEPEEGTEKTVPAVIAYLPSTKARPPPPPPSPPSSSPGSSPPLGACDYYQPLWERCSMNSVLFRGPKTVEELLQFITEHCLLPAPPSSAPPSTCFSCCCGSKSFNPLYIPLHFFPQPPPSPGTTTTHSVGTNAEEEKDWRRLLRDLALEVLHHHLIDLDVLFAVVDEQTEAYKEAVKVVHEIEKKRQELPLRRRGIFPASYMKFTPEEEAQDREDRRRLWEALRRARGERVGAEGERNHSKDGNNDHNEEDEEEGMMNWRVLGKAYVLDEIPVSRFHAK